MTFEEFQATGRDVPDLSALPLIAAQGIEPGQAGRVYAGDLFIETLKLDGAPTEYQLTIGSDSRISADLSSLEGFLYRFAKLQGYL